MKIKIFNSSIYSINAAALLLGAAGLLSRLLGIFRDRLLASIFGASRSLDIYYAAFQIPDFIFTLFLLGAASAAIIPIFIELSAKDKEGARRFITELIGVFVMLAVIISLGIFFLAPWLIVWITPGFSYSERTLTVMLMRIMMLSPVLLGVSSIISSVIQSFRRFFIFALSSLLYNLGIILGIIFFLPRFGLPGLAMGVILGAGLHLLIQFPTFLELGFSFPALGKILSPRSFRKISQDVSRVVLLSFPRVIALSIDSITAIFLVALASTLPQGSITIFKFANNLRYLPVGLFGVSFAVASFPALSEGVARHDATKFFETLYATLRSVLFWVMPLAILFYVLRAQIVRVALGAGHFTWYDTRLTAASLGLFVIAIVTESLIQLLVRSFYALGNTKKPLFINMTSAVFTVILAVFLTNLLKSDNVFSLALSHLLRVDDIKGIAVLGIALAVSIGDVLDFVLISRGLIKEADVKFGGIKHKYYLRDVVKMVIASLTAGLISFGALRVVNNFVSLDTFWGVFTQGAIASIAGISFYGLILYFWGNKEIKELIETIRLRMFSTKVLPQELDGQNLK